jgi:hypothetical protein
MVEMAIEDNDPAISDQQAVGVNGPEDRTLSF